LLWNPRAGPNGRIDVGDVGAAGDARQGETITAGDDGGMGQGRAAA
jgi:hypothetical protein